MPPGGLRARRSPLPYEVLAGVEPVTGGWLVATGNLQGIHLAPQPAMVFPTLAEVLDYVPAFDVVALHSPVGTVEDAGERRACDVEAAGVLGRRRGAAVAAPSRALLEATSFEAARRIDPSLDAVRWACLAKAAESIREVQSWRRNVFEVHPELGFMGMNGGDLVPAARRSAEGREMRRKLLEAKLPGSGRVLAERPRRVREEKLLDALADLWIARRIKAHAVSRVSESPVWDEEGIRMDIIS